MDTKRSRIEIEIDDLTCAICLSVPCGQIVQCGMGCHFFCRDCSAGLITPRCPTCRVRGAFTRSIFAEKCVRQLPWKCPYCDEELLHEGKAAHELLCPRRPFKCPKCTDTTCHGEFEAHVKEKHLEHRIFLRIPPSLPTKLLHFVNVPQHGGGSVLVALLEMRTTSDGIIMIRILALSSGTTPPVVWTTTSAIVSSLVQPVSRALHKITPAKIWSETGGTEIAITTVASIHSLSDKADRIELRFGPHPEVITDTNHLVNESRLRMRKFWDARVRLTDQQCSDTL